MSRFLRWLSGMILALILMIILFADRGALPGWLSALYAFPLGDKAGHFFLMGTLGLGLNLLLLGLRRRRPWLGLLPGSWAALALVTAEEVSQIGFAARSFSLFDLAFSILGIICADALLRWWLKSRGRAA